MKVKICGIQSFDMANIAVQAGSWALGFNFHPSSPRYISIKKAQSICQHLPSHITTVGIYTGTCVRTIQKLQGFLDFIQIYHTHLEVDTKRCILALNCHEMDHLPHHSILNRYPYILLDAPIENHLLGGTGKQANWQLASTLASKYPLIIAGGLNAANVAKAIQSIHPFAVDVASGVETFPGKKQQNLINSFIRNAKNA